MHLFDLSSAKSAIISLLSGFTPVDVLVADLGPGLLLPGVDGAV